VKIGILKKLYKKKDEEKNIVYDNIDYKILRVDPDNLNTKIPINFNIFLYMEKSQNLIQYFKKGHLLTVSDLNKLKGKVRKKIYVFKNEYENYKELCEFNKKFHYNEKNTKCTKVKKITMARDLNDTMKDQSLFEQYNINMNGFSFNVNENITFIKMMNQINTLARKKGTFDKINIILDTMRYHCYEVFKRIKTYQDREKTLYPIAQMLFKEESTIRLFYLALFFCIKNRVSDKNIVFHLVMNILKKKLNKESCDAYNTYWSHLVFREGISPEAIINITDTVKFCSQFETIINHLSPAIEYDDLSSKKLLGSYKDVIKDIAKK
jgi:hypothetical protein